MFKPGAIHAALLRSIFFMLIALITALAVSAQDVSATYRVQPLFETEDMLSLVLTTDLPALIRDRGDERDEHPASIAYSETNTAGADSMVAQDLKVRVRGNFRRKAHNCGFPPLRLNFAKKAATGTIFEGQDKMKLVIPCQEGARNYENYILLEYLTYRVYNQLTDFSFKVRFVEITFEDSSGKRKPLTNYGFLIEDEEAMARRNGGEILEHTRMGQEAMDRDLITLLSLFQYMIGNTDWYVTGLHNIKLVVLPGYAFPYPVPYDFDHAGMVDAEYALPHVDLPIQRVIQRYYKGYCRTQEELDPHIALFQEKKAAIYALFEEFPLLHKKYRKSAIRFLGEFYATLDKPKSVRRAFISMCHE